MLHDPDPAQAITARVLERGRLFQLDGPSCGRGTSSWTNTPPHEAPSRALQVSRAAVREVLRRGTAAVPPLTRPERALEHRDAIVELLRECEGSFMRVHEELTKSGLQLSYPALTAFCRRHGIGQVPKQPAGRYDFAPGQEMQHDTSPHDLRLGGQGTIASTHGECSSSDDCRRVAALRRGQCVVPAGQ